MEKSFEVLHEAVDTLKNTNESLSEKFLDLVKKLEEKIEANKLQEVIDTEKEIQEFITQHETEINQEGSVQKIKNEIEGLKKQVSQNALTAEEGNNSDPSNDVDEDDQKGPRDSMSDGRKKFWKWTGIAAAVGTIALRAKNHDRGKEVQEGGNDEDDEVGNLDFKEIASGYIDPLRGKGAKIPNNGYFGAPRPKKDKLGNIIGKRKHKGLDISAPEGTLIYPAMPGIVEKIGRSDNGGNSITLKHPNGEKTKYLHLKEKSRLSEGDRVDTESIIGLVGNTGVGTGPHLHFEVIKNGKAINPGGCCGFDYHEEGTSKGMVA